MHVDVIQFKTILKSDVTWSETGKKTNHGKKVYCQSIIGDLW